MRTKHASRAAAQPGIATDRFAREIVRILKARCGALAAAERQTVGRRPIKLDILSIPAPGVSHMLYWLCKISAESTMPMPKLIIIEGLMGSGKSTLARFLARQLQRNNYSAQAIVENTHPHPTNVMRALPHWKQPWLDLNADTLIATSVQKWHQFVQAIMHTEQLYVFDGQLFHGDFTSLLLMDHDPTLLLGYVHQIINIVRPLNPLVIYLYQADIAAALSRIGSVRGDKWITYQVNWKTHSPFCEQRGLVGVDGWLQFYTTYRKLTDCTFAQLDVDKLSIENSAGDWLYYQQHLLSQLGLTHVPDRRWQLWVNAVYDYVYDRI